MRGSGGSVTRSGGSVRGSGGSVRGSGGSVMRSGGSVMMSGGSVTGSSGSMRGQVVLQVWNSGSVCSFLEQFLAWGHVGWVLSGTLRLSLVSSLAWISL